MRALETTANSLNFKFYKVGESLKVYMMRRRKIVLREINFNS